MTTKSEENNRSMLLIAGISVIILALSFRVLMMMEDSLYEGGGLDDGVQTATLPLMALIALLIILLLSQIRRGQVSMSVENLRITALMVAMFLVGILIEPAIPRISPPPWSDAFGIILLVIPMALIVTMLLPDHSETEEEEE
ncbi:MAG: hypothetical protein VX954_02095 [Candidatus Thermoplasmatota archaeon]|jgi:cytochrome bd-type quinol oxidase subunit 2|nr:hypothetical protein [Candidatus Thermoplasmatota archaeon]|tara:strand:+ start:393 stop:818 length:426 start_codon:yes stop_codon:yes gene_type:complete